MNDDNGYNDVEAFGFPVIPDWVFAALIGFTVVALIGSAVCIAFWIRH